MVDSRRIKIEDMFDRLWPLPRSIAGQGFSDSLDIMAEMIPLKRLQYPTGTKVLDWHLPKIWEVRSAYFIGPNGKKYADFHKNNLHLVSYSVPFKGKMTLDELKPHLYTLPSLPKAIPYATSFFEERWGFCLNHEEYESLPEGEYEVVVDSVFKDGFFESGECVLPGESKDEILFSSYLCHPSMASNELSGPLVLAFLYEKIAAMKQRKYTYRFVLNAETVGTIAYLSKRGQELKQKVKAGYVLTCLGDQAPFNYKRSRQGNSLADQAALSVLKELDPSRQQYFVHDFDPSRGSEERQYCSPGYDLPVGSLMRSMYNDYKEYHSSLDNKDFISFDAMLANVDLYSKIVAALESNQIWVNLNPYGEPQLGRRNLYPNLNVRSHDVRRARATMWLLNLADGQHDLFQISERSQYPILLLADIAQTLKKEGLLVEASAKKQEAGSAKNLTVKS
ncbi:MAG: DUF4910 domain-containing protein [Deltaproteobacteria bacterium]|nr:DUF4910 domain-containing protein [Deltaproteobacteria bacterium]